ncbi:hypothetical protein CBM2585_A130072 [Cupriavidus taiwanensis]|nr:hypothetical protein CBM2585_A130072 [Cupriavidus taiwanensis]
MPRLRDFMVRILLSLQLAARRRDRRMPEVLPDVAQVHLLVSHV